MFYSGRVYEIVFRARRGIPMPARPLLNQIILSALARTQRDFKVKICNFIWMGNHVHLIIISQDIAELTNFYGELKKKLTESIKRLLNMPYCEHLSLWEDRTKVPQVLDLKEAVSRTIYAFCNPSEADLVDTIDEYPGLSTWGDFCTLEADITSASVQNVPWIQMPMLEGLSSQQFSKREESRMLESLSNKCKESACLTVHPFAWLKVFGVTNGPSIEKYRNKIITAVRAKEEEYKLRRLRTRKRAMGRERLLSEGINLSHIPKDHGPTLSVLTSINGRRIRFLQKLKAFKIAVRECYELMKIGATKIDWPLEAFVPRRPLLANPLWG